MDNQLDATIMAYY